MNPFEENHSLPEDKINAEENTYLDSLHDAEIFFSRNIKKTSHWSVPWSDLMMTMFILFALLYVYQTSNKEVQASAGKPAINYREEIKPVRTEILSPRYELTEKQTVKIILPGDVLFDTAEAELKHGAIGSLMAVGQFIQGMDYSVTVAGHTDNIPITTDRFPSNWELSTARACVAAKFLIEEAGILPSQIQVIGYAENRPIETNETPEGRKANRRVEVIISKDQILDNLSPL